MKIFQALPVATAMVAALLVSQPASATDYQIYASYFKVQANGVYHPAAWGTPAYNTGGDFYAPTPTYGGGVTGLPQAALSSSNAMVTDQVGADNRPVLSGSYSGPLAIHDVDSTTGELQWWTPGTTAGGSVITTDGGGSFTAVDGKFDNDAFFDSGGSGSDGYFRTAILSGTISLTDTLSQLTFWVGSDDDVFLYVDGALIYQDAGIHSFPGLEESVYNLAAGDHQFELFYADRNATNAEIDFQIMTQGLTVTATPPPSSPPPLGGTRAGAVPEPATWAMMLAGFGLIGATMRRRRATAALA